MDKIWDLLRDPLFWFAAIFVGFAVNILSAYLKVGIDRLAGRLPAAVDANLKRHSESYHQTVRLLADNPDVIVLYASHAHRYYIKAAVKLVFFAFFMHFTWSDQPSLAIQTWRQAATFATALATALAFFWFGTRDFSTASSMERAMEMALPIMQTLKNLRL